MENEFFSLDINGVQVPLPVLAIMAVSSFITREQTGQLTFHFTKGTLRQIQRNEFETVV